MSDLGDATLVGRCINGDKGAWDNFVERFAQLIFWAIRKRLSRANYQHNRQDLEDIFQNVFVLLWGKDKLRQIKNRQRISGWLVMVSANCALDYLRNKNIKITKSQSLTEEMASVESVAGKTTEREKAAEALEQILRLLPAREVIILKLNYLYDKTHREIAAILKIPENSISSIIKRTKERLKERLKNEW